MSFILTNARDLFEVSSEIDPEKHKNPNQGDKTPTFSQPKKPTYHIFDKNDVEKSCQSFAKHISTYRDLSGTNMPRDKKEDLSSQLHQSVHKSGGFTVKRHFKDAPKAGYMVSLTQKTEQTHPENDLHPYHVQNYMNQHKHQLAKINAHIGGWHDPETKKVYLDVSHHFPKMEDAVRAGRRANQLAIFDLKAGKSIYLQKKDSQETPNLNYRSVKEMVDAGLGNLKG